MFSFGSGVSQNARNGHGAQVKDYIMQIPKGFSIRVFKGPTLSSQANPATGKLDMGYRPTPAVATDGWQKGPWTESPQEMTRSSSTAPRTMPVRSSSYEVTGPVSGQRPREPVRSKTYPGYDIRPSGIDDTFIYECSVSSKSNLNSPIDDTPSTSDSFPPSPTSLSSVFSDSSTATLQSFSIRDGMMEVSGEGIPLLRSTAPQKPISVPFPPLVRTRTTSKGPGDREEARFFSSPGTDSSSDTTETPDSPKYQTRTAVPLATSQSTPAPLIRERRESLPVGSVRMTREPSVGPQPLRPVVSDRQPPGLMNAGPRPQSSMAGDVRRTSPERSVGGPRERKDSSPPLLQRLIIDPRDGKTIPQKRRDSIDQRAGTVPSSSFLLPLNTVDTVESPSYARQTNLQAPQMRPMSSMMGADQNPSRPLPPPPSRQSSEEERSRKISMITQARPVGDKALIICNTRCVRWHDNLICPSPIFPHQRRKGWYNRRGDQLWTNEGAYKPPPPGEEYPPDLDCYPDYGEGWMNEECVRIDMRHRLIPKQPLRSALKRPKAQDQHTELNARLTR